MAWDFTADSEIQTEVSTNLNTYADTFDAKVGEMYGKIDEMGTYWVGEDYDLFNTGCAGYKNALTDLSNSIRLYSTHFAHVSEGTVELAAGLIEIINNMTEFCGSGGSATGGQGGDPNGGGTGDPNGGGTGDPNGGGTGDPAGDPGEENPPTSGTPNGADRNGDGSVSYGEKVGGRYSDDWNGFKQDVSDRWNSTDGIIGKAVACVEVAGEFGNFVADAVGDTVQAAVDTVDYGANFLFDLGTGRGGSTTNDYWSSIGEDYSENWHTFGESDNFLTGAGNVVAGVVRTGVDVGQTIINAGATAIDAVVDAGGWVLDKIGDGVGAVLGWLF
ncbi:MAG: hypothetical protein II625_05340 [Bacilli bacterium]|nr:hypothetical protein [Bacilli bacterium]